MAAAARGGTVYGSYDQPNTGRLKVMSLDAASPVPTANVGDTLTARVEVKGLKPDKPVCQLAFTVTNQGGETVLEAEAWTYTLRPAGEERGGRRADMK